MVQSFKVPKLDGHGQKPGVVVLFQITRNGIRELQKRNFSEVLREEPVKLHGFSIEHDVLLVDVLESFRTKFPDSKLIHGKLFNDGDSTFGLNPDAILILPDGKTKWAIELELTLKAESRYREIVLKYRMAKDIDNVIYVTGHPVIREKITKVLSAHPSFVGGVPDTGKFFFINLNDLSRNSNASISNGIKTLNLEVNV
jgi:hypothetical protein